MRCTCENVDLLTESLSAMGLLSAIFTITRLTYRMLICVSIQTQSFTHPHLHVFSAMTDRNKKPIRKLNS